MERVLNFFEKRYKLCFIIIIAVISIICLVNLGTFSVQDWDEARHGVNAYEMYKNKEYIVTTYNYENDYWNLKPPISPILINVFFNLLGPSIFSFRLYSAISIIILAIIIGLFMKNRYGKVESIVSLILFAICKPIFLSHLGRYGDADAVFLLFTTVSLLSMFYIEKNKKYLYISGFFFSLAFLTKSWHAMFIVVIGGLYLLFSGEIKKIKFSEWIIFLSSFIIPIGIWMILRIKQDGYKFIQEMIRYDLLARTSTGIEGNGQNIFFYVKHIIVNISVSTLLLALLLIMIKYLNKVINKSNLPFILWIIVPFILFSASKTKLVWYIVPIYIPIILMSAYIIVDIIRNDSGILKKVIIFLVSISIIINSFGLIKVISNPDVNLVQEFIKEVAESSEIRNVNTYIDIESDKWSQSSLFIAELYLDVKAMDGGIIEFLNDENGGLLLITLESFNNNSQLQEYKRIYNNSNYIAIYK